MRPFVLDDADWYAAIRAKPEVVRYPRFIAEMGETEVLYMLDAPAWGKDYATEAALAARDFAFADLALRRLIALAFPANVASIGVMKKVGMACEGVFPAFGEELVRYAIRRPRS